MFTKPLTYIITKKSLQQAYDEINKNSSGLDEVDFKAFEKDFSKNINSIIERVIIGVYSPEPIKKIEIDKIDSDKKRPIALSAIKDKLVQKALYKDLNPYFDKLFSKNSYAYRQNKSTLKAINQTTEYINHCELF